MEGFLLNEQTWLQHLKEKRLAYGLSQNRLAVATGITRQYLSDIETGKVKPSEDLQQSLWEALERFNPCLLYTSPSPRDKRQSRMPSSA